MRVGRHVVEAGPRALDLGPAAGGNRWASRSSRSPKTRLVDRRVEAPARLRRRPSPARAGRGCARRKWKPVSCSTTIGRSSAHVERRRLEQLPAERPDRQVRRPHRPRPRPTTGRSRSTSTSHSTSSARTPSRTSTPRSAARRTSSRATAGGSATRRCRHTTAPSDVVRRARRPGTYALDGNAERRAEAPRARAGSRAVVGGRRGRGSRPAGRRAARASLEEGDALARERDLGRGRELLAHSAHRARRRPAGDSPRSRARRRGARGARGGTRSGAHRARARDDDPRRRPTATPEANDWRGRHQQVKSARTTWPEPLFALDVPTVAVSSSASPCRASRRAGTRRRP